MRAKMMKKPAWSYFVISRNSKPQKVVHTFHFQKFLSVNPSKIMFQGTRRPETYSLHSVRLCLKP